ncbi:MAG: molecular chaperone HtpG [Acutalibacteraceae bacterium]|nr:molecular chaperone HtpG [Acutalibacteraceae bacterium]
MAKKQFKAESKRLLDLMINSIYTNKEIFLREIISNASDASDKLHYLSLTDQKAREKMGELSIKITADKENRILTVTDKGIGMTKEELENNLGTICKSGSLQFKENMSEDEEKDAVNIIGQFGVGFYSAFMVADTLTVNSLSYKEDTAYSWTSVGADGYTIKECDKATVGTEIVMHIKEDTEDIKYSDYLDTYTLKRLIKTYSDYIRYPIKMDIEKSREEGEGENKTTVTYIEEETINSMVPVWKKSKSEQTEEETNRFYKDSFFDFEDPLFTISVSAEGVVSYKALLYIPSKTPYDYYTKEYEKGLKLYSSGVMIMEKCSDLVSEHFRFVKGVVDSDDLSLNISREMLQQDAGLKTISKNIDKKIHSELKKALNNDREKYEKFWKAFGIQLKYGAVAQYGIYKDQLKDLLLFWSNAQGKLITIEEYIKNMPEDQKHIYYACGETVQKIGSLPQAELVKAKGYDMLCLTDEVDEFLMNVLREENGKDYCSINSDKADLIDEADEKKVEETAEQNKEMLTFLKETLSIEDVIISKKLKTHPVCLSAKGGVTLEMEKYFASLPGEDKEKVKAQRVLELNPNHSAFEALAKAYNEDKEKTKTMAEVLYSQALLIAGLPIDNPSDYAEKVCSLF